MSVAAPRKGDARRAALLDSLDAILRETPADETGLDAINIAEISRRAGVTRSAFYFYFDNKQEAVAALMDQMYDAAFVATSDLSGDGTPEQNITATISRLFTAFDDHAHVFRAMLAARATSPVVRAMWDADRRSFIGPVAAMIEEERRAGRAPDGVPAKDLATVLLELNDRMLEQLTLGHALPRRRLVATVVAIWVGAIYGEART